MPKTIYLSKVSPDWLSIVQNHQRRRKRVALHLFCFLIRYHSEASHNWNRERFSNFATPDQSLPLNDHPNALGCCISKEHSAKHSSELLCQATWFPSSPVLPQDCKGESIAIVILKGTGGEGKPQCSKGMLSPDRNILYRAEEMKSLKISPVDDGLWASQYSQYPIPSA